MAEVVLRRTVKQNEINHQKRWVSEADGNTQAILADLASRSGSDFEGYSDLFSWSCDFVSAEVLLFALSDILLFHLPMPSYCINNRL